MLERFLYIHCSESFLHLGVVMPAVALCSPAARWQWALCSAQRCFPAWSALPSRLGVGLSLQSLKAKSSWPGPSIPSPRLLTCAVGTTWEPARGLWRCWAAWEALAAPPRCWSPPSRCCRAAQSCCAPVPGLAATEAERCSLWQAELCLPLRSGKQIPLF